MQRVTFRPRREPLTPVAIAGLGPHARALRERLLRMPDEALARFTGVATPDAVVVLGPSNLLPWFDGALYLGAQGALLMPSWAEPDVHPALLERALRRAMPKAAPGPLAVLLSGLGDAKPQVVPLGGALPLSRERLSTP